MNITEQFKWIENYEGRYSISSEGRVFSHLTGQFRVPTLTIRYRGDDYKVNLCKASRTKTFRIKKLVARHFIPNPKSLPNVINIDKDATNCSVSNLKWISREDQFTDHLTEENRSNFRQAGEKAKCKVVVNTMTGRKYPSAVSAEELLGLTRGFVTNQITKNQYKNNKLYQFRYI